MLWDNLFVHYEDVSLPRHIQIGLIKSWMARVDGWEMGTLERREAGFANKMQIKLDIQYEREATSHVVECRLIYIG